MIHLGKPKAVRAALTIAHGASTVMKHVGHGPEDVLVDRGDYNIMAHVRLDPDGVLWATDGVAVIRSLDAHDADISEPLYIECPQGYRVNGGEVGYTLDVAEGTLTEARPRSERVWQVNTRTRVRYPPVARLMPGNLTERALVYPQFDSIRGGKLAEAYGCPIGLWLPGHREDLVELVDLDEGDTIYLASVRRQ